MATPEAAKHRDIEQRFRDIERLLRDLASSAFRRPKFEVSEGDLTISGGDLIVDGGDFQLLDTDGSMVFRLGPQLHGDRGVSMLRVDGTEAVAVRKRFSGSTDQSIGIYDRNSKQLLVEEELGDGFAAPFFPLDVQPYLAASAAVQAGPHGFEVATTATSFTSTHHLEFFRQNQYLRIRVAVKASDTTTAAEVQVVNADTGNALRTFLAPQTWVGSRVAGSTGYTILEAGGTVPLVAPGALGSIARLRVQVRRTAGTGTLTVAVPFASGTSGAAF